MGGRRGQECSCEHERLGELEAAVHPPQVLPLALRPPLPSALRLPLPQALSPAMHPATLAVRSLMTALPAVRPVTWRTECVVERRAHFISGEAVMVETEA